MNGLAAYIGACLGLKSAEKHDEQRAWDKAHHNTFKDYVWWLFTTANGWTTLMICYTINSWHLSLWEFVIVWIVIGWLIHQLFKLFSIPKHH